MTEDKSKIERKKGKKVGNNGDGIKKTVRRDRVEDEIMMENDIYAETVQYEESMMTLNDIRYHYEYRTISHVTANCFRTSEWPYLESAG